MLVVANLANKRKIPISHQDIAATFAGLPRKVLIVHALLMIERLRLRVLILLELIAQNP